MNDIEDKLGYNREILIAFALLLGCDYDPCGVYGCGKEMASKFFTDLIELEKRKECKIDVLNLIRKWQQNDYKGLGIASEDRIRKLVCQNKTQLFPNEDIINEFLFIDINDKNKLINDFNQGFKWRRPSLIMSQVINLSKF